VNCSDHFDDLEGSSYCVSRHRLLDVTGFHEVTADIEFFNYERFAKAAMREPIGSTSPCWYDPKVAGSFTSREPD
jgi:hypothetical protein